MPALAGTHIVIAPDLPGVGCSAIEPARYDADNLARDISMDSCCRWASSGRPWSGMTPGAGLRTLTRISSATRSVTGQAMHQSGAVDFYARSYGRPGRLTAALGQYRALYTDADNNRRGAGPRLTMPTLALAELGETALSADSLRLVADNAREVGIPGAGHYIQEERPAEMDRALQNFLG